MRTRHEIFRTGIAVALLIMLIGHLSSSSVVSGTATSREVMRLGRGKIQTAAWRPDGKAVAIGTSAGVYLYSDTFEDAGFLDIPATQIQSVKNVLWSADGSQIITSDPRGSSPSGMARV